jgi:hypothetical protein
MAMQPHGHVTQTKKEMEMNYYEPLYKILFKGKKKNPLTGVVVDADEFLKDLCVVVYDHTDDAVKHLAIGLRLARQAKNRREIWRKAAKDANFSDVMQVKGIRRALAIAWPEMKHAPILACAFERQYGYPLSAIASCRIIERAHASALAKTPGGQYYHLAFANGFIEVHETDYDNLVCVLI